jgi:hypothetical protein
MADQGRKSTPSGFSRPLLLGRLSLPAPWLRWIHDDVRRLPFLLARHGRFQQLQARRHAVSVRAQPLVAVHRLPARRDAPDDHAQR